MVCSQCPSCSEATRIETVSRPNRVPGSIAQRTAFDGSLVGRLPPSVRAFVFGYVPGPDPECPGWPLAADGRGLLRDSITGLAIGKRSSWPAEGLADPLLAMMSPRMPCLAACIGDPRGPALSLAPPSAVSAVAGVIEARISSTSGCPLALHEGRGVAWPRPHRYDEAALLAVWTGRGVWCGTSVGTEADEHGTVVAATCAGQDRAGCRNAGSGRWGWSRWC